MPDPIEPADDPTPDPAPEPQPDPAPEPEPDDTKASSKAAYDIRKAREEADKLRKELEGYKRREDDARKSQLTKEQQLQEERDTLARENEKLKTERLQQKVANEFKLPATLAARLIGSDEESLRADAEELAKLLPRPKAGSPTDPARDQGQKGRIYTRAELQADPKLAASDEVSRAAAEGRVK